MNTWFSDIVLGLNSIIWSPALVIVCLVAGLYFSLCTRFVQVRRLKEMCYYLFRTGTKKGGQGISSFQAFCLALSGRVGTGNIVGVATAIGFGGPGAVVWMWIIAFFGAGSAFAESTLAQIYKESHNDDYRGGPAYYIEKGLKSRFFGMLFAIIATFAAGIFYPPVQSNGIALSLGNAIDVPTWIVGLLVAVMLGLVIFGGIKRISYVAQIVAPAMAIVYVLISLIIIDLNYKIVPGIFLDMIRSAFGFNEAFAGILGSTISWGVKRGVFSNEAGQGTGAIAAASAEVSHPVKQGLAQSFSVYIDTLLVCTATALIILACKTYNVIGSAEQLADGTIVMNYIQKNPLAPEGEPGVFYTSSAIGKYLGMYRGNIFTSTALFFFAFTTIMAYYYYAETNLIYFLSRMRMTRWEKLFLNLLRTGTVTVVFLGAVSRSGLAWTLGDIGVGSMAWLNIIAIILLSPKVIKVLRDYERQKKEGKDPQFHPKDLGIDNADFWEDNNSGK